MSKDNKHFLDDCDEKLHMIGQTLAVRCYDCDGATKTKSPENNPAYNSHVSQVH